MLKLLLVTLLLFGPSLCLGKKSRYGKWSYKKGSPYGPRSWGRIKGGANCLGSKQSPIDINTLETQEREFRRFRLRNFMSSGRSGNARPLQMSNNGKTVKITLEGDYLTDGGGLPSVYRAAQLHFHWGADWTRGSEHTFNGQSYPAELHIVHYDTVRYPTIGDALRQPNGLAVLGFFLKLGRHNAAWDPIINRLRDVRYTGNRVDFTQEPFQLGSLIPMDQQSLMKFYRYQGSLTTPGCYESVVWTVFHDPIELSESQLAQFRTLTRLSQPPTGPAAQRRNRGGADREEDLILNNNRPVQPTNWRPVFQSFEQNDPGEYESVEYESPDYESRQTYAYGGNGGRGGGIPNYADIPTGGGGGGGGGGGNGAGFPNYGGVAGTGGVIGDLPNYGGDYGVGGTGRSAGGGGTIGGGAYPNYGGAGGGTGSNSHSGRAGIPGTGNTGGNYNPPQIQNYDTNYGGNNYFGGADGNNDYDEFDANDFYGDPPPPPETHNNVQHTTGQNTNANNAQQANNVNNVGHAGAIPFNMFGGDSSQEAAQDPYAAHAQDPYGTNAKQDPYDTTDLEDMYDDGLGRGNYNKNGGDYLNNYGFGGGDTGYGGGGGVGLEAAYGGTYGRPNTGKTGRRDKTDNTGYGANTDNTGYGDKTDKTGNGKDTGAANTGGEVYGGYYGNVDTGYGDVDIEPIFGGEDADTGTVNNAFEEAAARGAANAGGTSDPYDEGHGALAGIAQMWQQFMDGQHRQHEDVAYYDGNLDPNDLMDVASGDDHIFVR